MRVGILALSFLILLGCGGLESPQTTRTTPAGGTSPVKAKASPALQVASWDEAHRLFNEQTGKVVVVDLWSTW